jgi:hypothetical protein
MALDDPINRLAENKAKSAHLAENFNSRSVTDVGTAGFGDGDAYQGHDGMDDLSSK